MYISKKFIILTTAGFPLLAAAILLNLHVVVFIVYNIICVCLLAADYIMTPGKQVFSIERDNWDKLYFMASNKITIRLRNNYDRALRVELKDEIPDWHFAVSSSNMKATAAPNTETEFFYDVTPKKRGGFVFQNIYVKYSGILGLCVKTFKTGCSMEYKVYPNLTDIGKLRILTQKNRLLFQGEKNVKIRGNGTDFESLREHVNGDDFRCINWQATARENKLIANEYDIEKNQPVFMLIDAGRPMSYSIKGYKKLDYSINAALILSDIVNRTGDLSGIIAFDSDIKSVIMPGKGQAHRNSIMEALYHINGTKDNPDYAHVFRELCARQKRRSIVFIFTDFETVDDAAEIIASIGIVQKRHIPVVVLIENESVGRLASIDEKNIQDIYRKAMAIEYGTERRKIIKLLRQKGIFCMESPAENFSMTAVNQYIAIKNKNIL